METVSGAVQAADKKEEETATVEEPVVDTELVSFSLAAHSLLMTAGYVLLVGNITIFAAERAAAGTKTQKVDTRFNMTLFGIGVIMAHYVLVELLLRGIKKRNWKMILPWFLVVVVEEFVLVGLGIWHIDSLMTYLDHSFLKLFQLKAAFIVTGIVMSVARYVLIARIAYSSWTSDYKRLR